LGGYRHGVEVLSLSACGRGQLILPLLLALGQN
jgi:hypothetical protein